MVPYYARVTVTECVPIKGQDASDQDSGADYPRTYVAFGLMASISFWESIASPLVQDS